MALLDAPQRNKLCRMIMTGASPLSPQAAANLSNGEALHRAGWEVRQAPRTPMLHSKVWIFGEEFAVIGSHNLTEAALSRNHEASVITDVHRIITRLHLYFADLWVQSTPIIKLGAQ